MDPSLVSKSLNFHGQQLQKMWEGERGDNDIPKIGVSQLDFAAYQSRQKHLSFQDRGKRVMLHQFIAKEAPSLFDGSLLVETPPSTTVVDATIPEDSKFFI